MEYMSMISKLSNRLCVLLILVDTTTNSVASDLSRFTALADSISKNIELTVVNSSNKKNRSHDNIYIQSVDYEFVSNGHRYDLGFSGDGFKDLNLAAKNTEQESFVAFKHMISLGPTLLVNRVYTKFSKGSFKTIDTLVQQYNGLMEMPNPEKYQHKIEELAKEIKQINLQQGDKRELANGRILFNMLNQTLVDPGAPTRSLVVDGKVYSGKNPSGNLWFFRDLEVSVEGAWKQDARGGVKSITDLVELGLVDSEKIKCARVSLWGIPFDGWMSWAAPSEARVFERGVILPGFKGGPKDVVVGKHVYGPPTDPSNAYHPKNGVILPTAMISARDKTPFNSKFDIERNNSSNFIIPPYWEDKLLPFAGMDENDRVFVFAWVAVQGNNGLFLLTQYNDESRPRVVFLDASGVAFRISNGNIDVGLKSIQVVENNKTLFRELHWGGNSLVVVDERKKQSKQTKPQHAFTSLFSHGEYSYRGPAAVKSTDEWETSTSKFNMPRALW